MKKWLDERILIFAWSFILIVCMIIIFTSPVKAATQDSTDLPYIVENVIPEDISFFEDLFKTSATNWGYPSDMIYRGNWESDKIIAYYYLNDGRFAYMHIYVPYNNNPSYNINLSKQYGIFDIDTDTATFNLINYQHFQFRSNDGSPWYYDNIWEGNFSLNFFGGNIIPDYISGNFYDSSDNLILTLSGNGPIVVSGHATPPINNNGHYIPNPHPNKPTPNIFNPPTPQFPTIDTSTIEKLLESLIDVVEYGFSYIGSVVSGWFNNLISNVSDYLEYISDILISGFNNVVGAIQDLATDFYNNMVSLFEPISNAISYIAQPISGTVIYDNLSNTGIITNYNSIITTVTGFQDGFTNLSEPSEFKIPIHLENLPSSYFGTLTTQYIDLSVINPVKSIIRGFLWALVTYSLFVTIIDSIANYINGGGDE